MPTPLRRDRVLTKMHGAGAGKTATDGKSMTVLMNPIDPVDVRRRYSRSKA
jgi:hypothetical protein